MSSSGLKRPRSFNMTITSCSNKVLFITDSFAVVIDFGVSLRVHNGAATGSLVGRVLVEGLHSGKFAPKPFHSYP